MARFVALTDVCALPVIGQDIERAVMDWKVKPATFAFERAKDVAAFANHLGGTILLGAHEVGGQLKSYVGLDASEAGKARDEYSKAVADRCKPRPAIEFEQFPCPEKPSRLLVAINVDPSLSLVGVEVTADKARENYGGEAFVFPIRSGTDARYLEPGQLPMFMTPQIRRVAVMASRIPPGTVVYFRNTGWRFEFLEVCEEENVLRFREPVTPKPRDVNLPLDRVLSVYQGADGEWMMVIETLH